MVNVFLCVIAAIMAVAIIAINIYLIVYFQDEEDKNTAWFPKIIVVATFTLVCYSVLMMPLDVGNSRTKRPDETGIPMDILWKIIWIAMIAFAFIVPFAFFYYEAEDPESGNAKQIKAAIKWDCCWAWAFFIPTLILWIFIGYVEVPVIKYYSPLQEYDGNPFPSAADMYNLRGQHLTYRISFVLYLISMITFVGTFVLIFFGGVGLAALPMDLINGFRKREKRMTLAQYAERKNLIGKRSGQLLEKGKSLRDRIRRSGGTRPTNRKDTREFNAFRNATLILESEWKKLDKSYNKGMGPTILAIVWEWLQLLFGILGLSISVTWLIHVIVYMAPRNQPYSLFLNSMFSGLDDAFGLFGTTAYAIYSFYLLWCVIKGLFKVGVRIPFLCTIHPMQVGETLMNAFLFNAFVVLLSAFAVVKFCAASFKDYTVYTGMDILFNVGVENIRYIKYFWFYYYWAMIALAILTALYLFILPSDKKAANKDQEEELPMY